jgi:hypothetical protein
MSMVMLRTRFTTLLGCAVPLQQAGMGGVATPPLAVADAGALGMLWGTMVQPPILAEMLDGLAAGTQGVFGVNFLIPFLDRDAVAVAATRADVVEFFYGKPDATLVYAGTITAMALYAGESVGAVRGVVPAADIVREFAQGAERLLRRS